MLTSKERAQLRGLANTLSPVVMIGKDGITEGVLSQTAECLESHELIKIKILETAFMTAKTAAQELCENLGADPVQCIGSKLVIYRESKENKQIILK